MDKKQKLEMIQRLREKSLTKRFLIPLYESKGMGYKSVRYNHGVLEFGKDMICYEDDRYEKRIFTGIQVKATRITTRDVAKILLQITEAFGQPFTDTSDGKTKELDRVIILTSKEFVDSAKSRLWASLRGANIYKLVTFVDGNVLVRLLDKHCPLVFHSRKHYYPKDSKQILNKFREMLNGANSLDFKPFLRANPWLVGVGSDYETIAPEEDNTDYPYVDISLKTFDGDYDVMVLKDHTAPIILNNHGEWNLSQECVLGISMVYRYFEWYNRKIEREQLRPTEYLYDPGGFVVIGRSASKEIRKRLRLINAHFGRIQILTYDDIYERAVRLIKGDTWEGES